MAVDTWDDERIAALTKMWADGYSSTRIGVALGLTRNAVIGKVNRLQLPEPASKLPVIVDFSYRSQCKSRAASSEVRRAKAKIHEKAYRERRKYCLKTKREVREKFIASGASPYSAAYRKHLPPLPDMSKEQMRAMLAQAMQNTAAL